MLTDVKARNAKPADKAYKLPDADGLYLQVLPGGAKTWRVRYERNGKESGITLGRYPSVTLADARTQRDQIKTMLRDGKDPTVEKAKAEEATAVAAANTFRVVATRWLELQTRWSAKHREQVEKTFNEDVCPIEVTDRDGRRCAFGDRPISDITPPQVVKVVRLIEARPAVETAHRTRQRISAVFVFGIAEGVCENDPAAVVKKALKKVTHKAHPAIVTLDGVREVVARTESIPAHPTTRLGLRLIALTAVRSNELARAERTEFEGLDTEEPFWRIPKERMKGKEEEKREHLVPLSRQAVEVVRLAIARAGRGRLLFPNAHKPHKPMSENAILYLLNRAGYAGLHCPHGFRSSFSTIMNERSLADKPVIDMMLAHVAKDKVEAAYNRALYVMRRRAVAQEYADLLLAGFPTAADIIQTARR